jgi:hypothetical protein
MASSGRRVTSRVGLVLACVVVACLLGAMSGDPGSGTATNLHPVDDVASLVVGAHHAKPIPTTGSALVAALLAVLAAVARGGLLPARPVATYEIDLGNERFPRQLVSWAARAWRAPPPLFTA